MAFVPGYEHDIFVSYAHVDDEPTVGADKGWVTTLIDGLKVGLSQKLGRKDAFALWMDHDLSRHESFSAEIELSLRKTAIYLVILSPGYLESEWCARERDVFLEAFEEKAQGGARIFLVERERIDKKEKPDAFRDLLGYRFWVDDREGRPPRTLGVPNPDSRDHTYFDLINDLGYDLAKLLKTLKQEEPGGDGKKKRRAKAAENEAPEPTEPTEGEESTEPEEPGEAVEPEPEEDAEPADSPEPEHEVEPQATRTTVLLAEVTDDLDSLREGTRRYLEQAGFDVVPRSPYRLEPSAFREALDKDLEQASLFVQLLSGLPGKRPDELPQGYVALQAERAAASATPVLQWRNRALKIDSIEDESHRQFLEGPSVIATNLEEFKAEALRHLRKTDDGPSAPLSAFVFVNVEQEDLSIAQVVGEALDAHGIAYVMPMMEGGPSEVRLGLQQNLLACDALIVINGRTPNTWVEEQLRFLRKHLHQRETPLEMLSILDGTSEDEQPLNFKLPEMKTLDCRAGVTREALDEFLSEVKEKLGGE